MNIIFLIIFLLFLPIASQASANPDLRVGLNWDRRDPTLQDLENPVLRTLLLSTAKIHLKYLSRHGERIGSGLYLGVHQGEHLLMTNYHIIANERQCSLVDKVIFEASKSSANGCWKIILSIPEIDLTIISMRAQNLNIPHLNPIRFNTAFLKSGSKLYTVGYGGYLNSPSHITMDTSSSCQVMLDHSLPIYLNDENSQPIDSIIHACELSK